MAIPFHQSLVFLVLGKVFAHCDLGSTYWQIPLSPQDRHKSAFCIHVGPCEYLRLPFGLKTKAPNTFERILNTVFADYLHQCLTVYVDDFIMWSHTPPDTLHTYDLTVLFARSVQAGIQFKPAKCTFFSRELQVLGHTITEHSPKATSKGIEAIANMQPPSNVTFCYCNVSIVERRPAPTCQICIKSL